MVDFNDGPNQCQIATINGPNQWNVSARATTLSNGHNTTNAISQWRPQPMQYISTRATIDGRFQQWQQPMRPRWNLLIYWVFIFIIFVILARRCPCQLCCRLTERSNSNTLSRCFSFFSFSILLLCFSLSLWIAHSEHRFPAPSSLKAGCRKPVLGVCVSSWYWDLRLNNAF